MVDSFGLLDFPVAADSGGADAPGDPLLVVLGSYLRAVFIANGQARWDTIGLSPGATKTVATPVVKTVIHNDPQEGKFNSNDLPALFVWRDTKLGHTFDKLADDIVQDTSTVNVLWVPPATARVNTAPLRMAFYNALAKMAASAIAIGQDPSWFADGETDPDALQFGSSLMTAAGMYKPPRVKTAQAVPLVIEVEGVRPSRPSPGVMLAIEVIERSYWDATLRGSSVAQAENQVIQAQDPNGYIVVTSDLA